MQTRAFLCLLAATTSVVAACSSSPYDASLHPPSPRIEDAPTAAPQPPAPTPPAGPTSSVDAGADAGPSEPEPGDRLKFLKWPAQQSRSGGTWGSALTDIANHLPASYGTQYDDSDTITFGHETTHGINSHLRNYENATGKRANGFYLMSDRGAIVVEPNLRKSQIAPYVPASLRGSRYGTYITGQTAWDDTPTYVLDEWIAYVNGSEVGVDRVKKGLWNSGWRDGVMGTLEFSVYACALVMAVEKHDAAYFAAESQLREFVAWNLKRAMALYEEGSKMKDFAWADQDAYYARWKTSADALALRDFIRKTYGASWVEKTLGLPKSG